MSSEPLKCAVIGAGHLGRLHAKKYAQIPDCELVAAVDIHAETAAAVASKYAARALTDYRDLLGKVDAVSIATPPHAHFEIARDFIRRDAHVLVEKPMCLTRDEADALLNLVEKRQTIFQVGHVERFNPAFKRMRETARRPRFIDARRLGVFHARSADVSVVLDLMIHDIDLVLNLVDSPVASVHSAGAALVSKELDTVNARITFEDGCVANLLASRLMHRATRALRVFEADAHYSLDLLKSSCRHAQVAQTGDGYIKMDSQHFVDKDPLREEIMHFIDCIRSRRQPLVSAADGRRALLLANDIARNCRHF